MISFTIIILILYQFSYSLSFFYNIIHFKNNPNDVKTIITVLFELLLKR